VKTLVVDEDATQVADLLLFLASMEKVLGVTIGDFEKWMVNWWESLDITVRNTRIMKEKMVVVNKVKWFLTEKQEASLITKGITYRISPDIITEAQILYDKFLASYKANSPPLLSCAKIDIPTPEVCICICILTPTPTPTPTTTPTPTPYYDF
jgi:hypothetical protein